MRTDLHQAVLEPGGVYRYLNHRKHPHRKMRRRANRQLRDSIKRNSFENIEDTIARNGTTTSKPRPHHWYPSNRQLVIKTSILINWLEKYCGKEWNQVYSKLRTTYDTRNDSKYLLLEIVSGLVDIYGSTVNGDQVRGYGLSGYCPYTFYVKDGILYKTKPVSFSKKDKSQAQRIREQFKNNDSLIFCPIRLKPRDPWKVPYICENGIFFRLRMGSMWRQKDIFCLKEGLYRHLHMRTESLMECNIRLRDIFYTRYAIYAPAIGKRSADKKEIKKIKEFYELN